MSENLDLSNQVQEHPDLPSNQLFRGEGQKIVHKLMAEVSTQSSNRKPDFYLKFLQVLLNHRQRDVKEK